MSGPFKMKGWSPFTKKSPAKHGDGSWGGTEDAPVVEDVMEKKAKAKQTKSIPQPPPRTEFHTDESYARVLARWKAEQGVE